MLHQQVYDRMTKKEIAVGGASPIGAMAIASWVQLGDSSLRVRKRQHLRWPGPYGSGYETRFWVLSSGFPSLSLTCLWLEESKKRKT